MKICTHLAFMRPDESATIRAGHLCIRVAFRKFPKCDGDAARFQMACEAHKRAYDWVRRLDHCIEMFDDPAAPSNAPWWRPEESGAEWQINHGILKFICNKVRSDFLRSLRKCVALEDYDSADRRVATERQRAIVADVETQFFELEAVEQGVLWTVPRPKVDYFANDRFEPDFDFLSRRLVQGDRETGIPHRVERWSPADTDRRFAPSAKKTERKLLTKIWRTNHEQ